MKDKMIGLYKAADAAGRKAMRDLASPALCKAFDEIDGAKPHKEPDADNKGGKSDGDADNLAKSEDGDKDDETEDEEDGEDGEDLEKSIDAAGLAAFIKSFAEQSTEEASAATETDSAADPEAPTEEPIEVDATDLMKSIGDYIDAARPTADRTLEGVVAVATSTDALVKSFTAMRDEVKAAKAETAKALGAADELRKSFDAMAAQFRTYIGQPAAPRGAVSGQETILLPAPGDAARATAQVPAGQTQLGMLQKSIEAAESAKDPNRVALLKSYVMAAARNALTTQDITKLGL